MNANNHQSSSETHWVNTKTMQEVIDLLYEANHKTILLWNDADGYEDLRQELRIAFDHMTESIKAMKDARIVNKLKRKEN